MWEKHHIFGVRNVESENSSLSSANLAGWVPNSTLNSRNVFVHMWVHVYKMCVSHTCESCAYVCTRMCVHSYVCSGDGTKPILPFIAL